MIKANRILIKNIYYMLAYAFRALNQMEFIDADAEEFENIHNLFAAILSMGISRQLKQGLYRSYKERTEDIPVMRGRLNMAGTVRSRISQKYLLTCEYDVFSEDCLPNRILKTTALLLMRQDDVDAKYRDSLKKEMLFFSNVGTVDPVRINWSEVRIYRGSRHYRMLINICQLIMEGMLLCGERGDYHLAAFLDEQRMCRLYEKFILEYYIKEFPQIKAASSQIPWALDGGDGAMLPNMRSDVTLSIGNTVLIIEAKYYSNTMRLHYEKHTLHSDNLYQIFTYVKNRDAGFGEKPHEVSGIILYARTDESIQPDSTYIMSGNHISVRTLSLNCDFSAISQQLDDIAERYFAVRRQFG